jgi:hypothetical protein
MANVLASLSRRNGRHQERRHRQQQSDEWVGRRQLGDRTTLPS